MGIVTGVRTSANTTSTNQAQDMDPVMHYIQEYQTPITQFSLTNKLGSKPVTNKKSKFEWHEKSPLSRSFALQSSLSGSTTGTATLAAGDSGILRLGDTIFSETTGQMFIVYGSADPTTSATVRLVGSGTITTVASGATMRIINSAKKENYTRGSALTNNADAKYGYCQIGLDAVEMSGREDAGEAMTDGESFTDLMKEKFVEISKYEERKFIYNGVPYHDTTNNITYSGGAKGMITTNVDYITGDLDEAEIDGILLKVFAKYSGGNVVGYAGTGFISQLNKLMKDRFIYNTDATIKTYGGLVKNGNTPRLLEYPTPWGFVYFVWEPMLEGNIYSNACLFLNQKHIRMRYMKNDSRGTRKYRVEPDVEDPGTGSKMDQIMWDTGVEIREEVQHGWLLPAGTV